MRINTKPSERTTQTTRPVGRFIAWLCFKVAAVVLLAVSVLLPGCSCRQEPAPPATANYSSLVSLFTVGSIALETGDKSGLDVSSLTTFTKQAPDEPAGWADLGLYEIRNNKLTEAEAHLAKAQSLAPGNAGIEKLFGLLADRKGDLAGSIAHYQQAIKLAPDDLRAHYALAEQMQRQNTPEGDAGYQQQMEAIISLQPTNLHAQLCLLTVAAKRGDKAGEQRALTLVQADAASFDSKSRRYFEAVKAEVNGTGSGQIALDSRFLYNTLQQNINYQAGMATLVRASKDGAGDALLQFIKLPAIPSKPDAPDTAIKFTPSLLRANGSWVCAIWLDDTGKQIVATAGDGFVQLAGGGRLPFPGKAPAAFGVLPLDVNYDLRNDLFFAGSSGIKLYIQSKAGAFVDSTLAMKLPSEVASKSYSGAWPIDIEADGDLDIVLGSSHGDPTVLQNNGDGTWQAIHPFKGVDGTVAFASADVDGDGNPDVAIIDATHKLHVFMNLRGGIYKERTVPISLGNVSAVTVADLRGEGRMSFILLDATGAVLRLSDKGAGTDWEVTPVVKWDPAPKDLLDHGRLFIADLDNNGGLDIIASSATQSQAWLCGADHTYSPLAVSISGSVVGIVKPETGGRYDLLALTPDGKPQRLVNSGSKNYNWQDVRPRPWPSEFNKGKADRRVNSFGIGGEVAVRAGLLYENLPMDSPSIHFGIGSYPALDAVSVVWPNNDHRAEFADKLKTDSTVELVHRLEESCPFLFTWNGKEMQFVTDCIWRSPLGLKINAQDTAGVAMTQDWVKIGGDQLGPDANGQYDLRVTAELNETHFFDHLSLLVVDHPVGTDIFVDERYAIPPPPLKVYPTTPLEPIKRAVDDTGADVTQTVAARDGKYLDTFGRGEYQGVTRDHWVEVELNPPPPGTGRQWLICNGFIYPTNSSINVAMGQGHADPPKGLSIETPDAQGRWTVAKAGLGFPEGKVKTILIDLTGVFKPNAPHKLRLRTNLEIYWDAIQTAYSTPDSVMKITHLGADAADLHYRGFSEIKAADISSPGLPTSYDRLISVGPQWRDLEGYYTRYGDVKELLDKIDDRYVIMNAGDELSLKFKAPDPPAAGYIRDYVLIGDGWVKDGDYNTTFSKTVLPLPEHATSTYSVRPTTLENDPVYRKHARDWDVYQTRYVSPQDFGRQLLPGR